MFDERGFIAEFESAKHPAELARFLRTPTPEQERALRVYLGADRFERMRDLALRVSIRRGAARQGNVVVIPGIMGSELTVFQAGAPTLVWLSYYRLLRGWLDRLRLAEDGRSPFDPASGFEARATGILNKYYGEALLSLGQSWNVRPFWYDWRRDLDTAAAQLEGFLTEQFGDQDVHIVAHSMGGLVARTMLQRRQGGAAGAPQRGGRLVMLGTPNYGSFEVPQILAGIQDTVQKLVRLVAAGQLTFFDTRAVKANLLATLDSFPGVYQMLPWPQALADQPNVAALYQSQTYASLNSNVVQQHLDAALRHHELLANTVDPACMIYVAGALQPTADRITDPGRLDQADNYGLTLEGDGRVPHRLGLLPGVATYYVVENHGDLIANGQVLAALEDLLADGRTDGLSKERPSRREQLGQAELRNLRQQSTARENELFDDLIRRLRSRDARVSRTAAPESGQGVPAIAAGIVDAQPDTGIAPVPVISPDEDQLETQLAGGFLGYAAGTSPAPPPAEGATVPKIVIRLACAGLQDLPTSVGAALPVNALSVGHYAATARPQSAIKALDDAISRARLGAEQQTLSEHDFLLTQLIERGVLRGDLGHLFLLPDPRARQGVPALAGDCAIAIAGMGLPGRFGTPELNVLARELCWALGRIGKRHLATVVIGAGRDNLGIDEAIQAWLQGVARAIGGSVEDQPLGRLEQITFVEEDPRRIEAIDAAIQDTAKSLTNKIVIEYAALTEREREHLLAMGAERDRKELEKAWRARRARRQQPGGGAEAASDLPPTRVTVGLEADIYSFGAITESASIPERRIPLDPALVGQANDELAAEASPSGQRERGEFLGRLLIPRDLRPQFFTAAPLVMLLDSTTARIHWEMVAEPDVSGAAASIGQPDEEFPADSFLGTARGLTRQLRTQFAMPPEPPPPPRRLLRVLVVADPAADAHLPGAAEEGVEVADLFESFNRYYDTERNRIEVVRLFGPSSATRTNVLREIMARPYDVLHYAGHCFYNTQRPSASGWIFSRGQTLSANELNRIDHVPRFVFSNACESGITPDRSEQRTVELAPSFAEAFFQGGVANFVCTAWPVDDLAARQFARQLYAALLGLRLDDQLEVIGPRRPLPMHKAMHQARRAIAQTRNGARTWGAYQHYGSPHWYFFDPDHLRPLVTPAEPRAPVAAPSPPPVLPRGPFDVVRDVARAHETELKRIPGVIGVRPGFRFKDGWITNEPVVVVSVQRKLAPEDVPPGQRIPATVAGVPTDVTPATPVEQLRTAGVGTALSGPAAAEEELLLPGEQPEIVSVAGAAVRGATRPYQPPPDLALDEVSDAMTLTCHASPDAGWPTLSAFLQKVQDRCTIGMYDFTAPHILDALTQAMRAGTGDLSLVLDPGLSLSAGGEDDNPKANDKTEDEVRSSLADALHDRFHFDWAAVKRAGKTTGGIFPSAYHIKVAVRDGDAFWLSSGNWQSSNQPDIDPLGDDGPPPHVFDTFNREWHVVVEHPGLADLYERFLKWDMEQAAPLQDAGGERALPPRMPDLLVPIEPDAERGPVRPQFFAPKVLKFTSRRQLKVQPLLTPDNYAAHIRELIDSAREKLYFQNQYIHLTRRQSSDFADLVESLKEKVSGGLDVRIILRDIGNTRAMLTALRAAEFDMTKVKLQKNCHNKGIIIDSEVLVLGSHNWSSDGTTANRDASLVLFDAQAAAYYEQIFLYDWENLARQKVIGERAMPVVLGPTGIRGRAPTPADGKRIPWDSYFED